MVYFRGCLGPIRSFKNSLHSSRAIPFSPDGVDLLEPPPNAAEARCCNRAPIRDRPTVSVNEKGSMSTAWLSTTSDMGLAATSEVEPATVKTWGFMGGRELSLTSGVVRKGLEELKASGRIGMRGPGRGAAVCSSSMEGM